MINLLEQVDRFQRLSEKTGTDNSSYTLSINFDLLDKEVKLEWGCYDITDYPRHYRTTCSHEELLEHMKATIDYMEVVVAQRIVEDNQLDEGGRLMNSTYQDRGYESRDDYLACLSEDFGVPLDETYRMAELLGEEEEFDALPKALQEFGYWFAVAMEK